MPAISGCSYRIRTCLRIRSRWRGGVRKIRKFADTADLPEMAAVVTIDDQQACSNGERQETKERVLKPDTVQINVRGVAHQLPDWIVRLDERGECFCFPALRHRRDFLR